MQMIVAVAGLGAALLVLVLTATIDPTVAVQT